MRGGLKQGCPLSPQMFMIVLELMANEMRREEGMKGIVLNDIGNNIASDSDEKEQIKNEKDRLLMLADEISTTIEDKKHTKVAK